MTLMDGLPFIRLMAQRGIWGAKHDWHFVGSAAVDRCGAAAWTAHPGPCCSDLDAGSRHGPMMSGLCQAHQSYHPAACSYT